MDGWYPSECKGLTNFIEKDPCSGSERVASGLDAKIKNLHRPVRYLFISYHAPRQRYPPGVRYDSTSEPVTWIPNPPLTQFTHVGGSHHEVKDHESRSVQRRRHRAAPLAVILVSGGGKVFTSGAADGSSRFGRRRPNCPGTVMSAGHRPATSLLVG